MTLRVIDSGARGPIALATIGSDKDLAIEVQNRLWVAGLLDAPADGEFGPVSHWAIAEFNRKAGWKDKSSLDAELAARLLDPAIGSFYPVKPSNTLAGRICSAILGKGWSLSRHPDCVNIVYIEGLDADGTSNGNTPNAFDDLRLVLRINRSGTPEIVDQWEATTEPGKYYTKLRKLDPRGAARIAFGQYKSWAVGMHPQGNPTVAHEALVQVHAVTVHRDGNEDFRRDGDLVDQGLFGINQHWGYNLPKRDIGNASAGCLVGRTTDGHKAFMALVKQDPRHVTSRSFRFTTTVMPASAVT